MKTKQQVINKLLATSKFETPLVFHPNRPNMLFKLEGAGMSYGHKFRSACYITAKALLNGVEIKKIADRSSGSWSMALAWVANQLGVESRFTCVGEPAPYVRVFVESLGGSFDVVNSNADRIERLNQLVAVGFWCPDQHANAQVIEAFENTIGDEVYHQLQSLDVSPSHVIGPIGTGGLLAGVSKKLRDKGQKITSLGIDLNTSIVHSGERHAKYPHLNVRGVGSDDEICETLLIARQHIDQIITESSFSALEQLIEFPKQFPCSIGMSSALTVSAALTFVENNPNVDSILCLLPDRGDAYTKEFDAGLQIFRNI